jgi:hypothetical protein
MLAALRNDTYRFFELFGLKCNRNLTHIEQELTIFHDCNNKSVQEMLVEWVVFDIVLVVALNYSKYLMVIVTFEETFLL